MPDSTPSQENPPSNVASFNDEERAAKLVDICNRISEQVANIGVGQKEVIDQILIAILARGHCLREGAPGLAKTKAIKELAEGIEAQFHRIQFTPDLLPADITGTEIYRPETGSSRSASSQARCSAT